MTIETSPSIEMEDFIASIEINPDGNGGLIVVARINPDDVRDLLTAIQKCSYEMDDEK